MLKIAKIAAAVMNHRVYCCESLAGLSGYGMRVISVKIEIICLILFSSSMLEFSLSDT